MHSSGGKPHESENLAYINRLRSGPGPWRRAWLRRARRLAVIVPGGLPLRDATDPERAEIEPGWHGGLRPLGVTSPAHSVRLC